MTRFGTRLRVIVATVLAGLGAGASVGIVSGQAQRAATPGTAVDELAVLSSAWSARDVMPAAVAGPAEAAVSRAAIGTPELSATRDLLDEVGSARATVYAFPTSDGHACFVSTNGPAECVKAFSHDQPIASILFDPDELRRGTPVSLVGLASDSVVAVKVTVNGTAYAAMLRRNAFYFEAPDPSLGPNAIEGIRVELNDGSTYTEMLAPVLAPTTHGS